MVEGECPTPYKKEGECPVNMSRGNVRIPLHQPHIDFMDNHTGPDLPGSLVYFSLILCFGSVWQPTLATHQGNCEGGPQIVSASAVLKSYHNCGTHYSKDQFEQSSPLSSRQLHGWHVVYQRRGRNAQPCNVYISGVFRGRWCDAPPPLVRLWIFG